jgi:hypothetical protein
MSSTEPANTFPDPAQPAPAPTQEPAQPSMRDVPLGTLIFRAGLLGEEQLEDALQEGMRTGKRLGEVLLERGWLNERDLGRMLAGQKGLPFVDVSVSDVEPDALEALGEEDARRQVSLPLFYEDGKLVIAVGDPSNELVLESLRRELETEFQLVVAPHGQLRQVIDEAYARPAPDPAPHVEGVLFPELLPEAQVESPEPQPEPEPVLEFTPAVEPEPEPEPQAKAAPEIEPEPESEDTTQPFSGSTPTLLSRMLFPSVRHASQEVETAAAEGPEPEAQAPEPAEEPEAEAPEPAGEDFAELEVPAVPEMPLPSFEQPAPESQPAEVEAPSEPAAEPEPESVPEPEAEAEPEPEPEPEPEAEAEPEPEPVPEPEAEAEPEPEPEPEPEAEAEAAETPKYSVLVRLRDGDALPIGEPGSADEASALAQDAVGQISSAAGNGTWPLFAGRYLSPDTIVSVDLHEESPDT